MAKLCHGVMVLACAVWALAACGSDSGGTSGTDVPSGDGDTGASVTPPNLETVSLSAGCFQMGCATGDADCEDDEKPAHEVCVGAFELGKTEVTAAQFEACVADGGCTTDHYVPWEDSGVRRNCNVGNAERATHPANCVSWDAATEFAVWLAGRTGDAWRLPTEAEWEYAARGEGRDVVYPWGNDPADCDHAVLDEGGYGCGTVPTWPVCSKAAGNTLQGACDMSGNAKEWVSDRYGAAWYAESPKDAPAGPVTGDQRVLKGGSWDAVGVLLRISNRLAADPTVRANSGGFRLVK